MTPPREASLREKMSVLYDNKFTCVDKRVAVASCVWIDPKTSTPHRIHSAYAALYRRQPNPRPPGFEDKENPSDGGKPAEGIAPTETKPAPEPKTTPKPKRKRKKRKKSS